MICGERTGSIAACGSSNVENMVKSGLVRLTVKTTRTSAIVLTVRRGIFITGDNCEILSSPEKARKDPAKPTSKATSVRERPLNMEENKDKNCSKEICRKTVTRIVTSLPKAMIAPTILARALALTPTQFKMLAAATLPG